MSETITSAIFSDCVNVQLQINKDVHWYETSLYRKPDSSLLQSLELN